MAKNEKRNRDNGRRRLLLLILLLALTLCVATFSTYAWFTSNKKVNVDDLDVDVRAVNGLEISADAINWGVKIDKDDLISNAWTGHKNQLPDSLGHASSAKNLTSDNLLQMFDGVVATNCPDGGTDCDNPTYTLTTSSASESRCYDSDGQHNSNSSAVPKCSSLDKHLMAFDIFLKVDRDGTTLYLTENANVANTSVDDLGIKNTARVAFVVQGNISSLDYRNGVNGVEGYTVAQNLQNGEQVIFWEPNFDEHTIAGVAAARQFYDIEGITAGTGNSALAYDGVTAAIPTNSPIPLNETRASLHSSYFAPVSIDITSPAKDNERVRQSSKIVLNNGVTKVRVYFWVEGQDVDTENTATGSNMKLNLEFSID